MSKDLVISQATTLVVAGAPLEAEKALVAFANEHGDKELCVLLDEMEPKYLSAIVREFDCSKSSPISSLVNVEQFVAMLIHERHYNELNKLEGLINSIMMARDEPERHDFLAAISESGCEDILAIYLLGSGGQNYEALMHFNRYGTFNLGWECRDSHAEACDGEWKQFAFELHHDSPSCWQAVFECIGSTYTKILQAERSAHNNLADSFMYDARLHKMEAPNNKNQRPIFAEQADENSAL